LGIIAGAAVLLLGLFVGVSMVRGKRARAALAAKYPPPGQMVDVGGYRLHIYCQGASQPGVPTVVLDAGASEFSLTWDHVQGQASGYARVCAYDRAGLGWSERGPRPRTTPHVVDELDALLAAAGVEPPYVLVGHSMGALYARYYAHTHPDRVVGMVLVDGAHEEETLRLPEALLRINRLAGVALRIPQVLSAIGVTAQDPAGYPEQFLTPQPPGTAETHKAVLAMNRHYWNTALAESAATEESYAAIRSLPSRSLGDLPLVVISAGKLVVPDMINLSAEERASVMNVWAECQTDLVALSSKGRQVIAEEAGHYVHIDRPDLVIEAIREVVEAAQAQD
jgi:pimeloyl-ACP methyl ester carboxylesterase